MTYHIEHHTSDGWQQVSAALPSWQVAHNLQRSIARLAGESTENYSILITGGELCQSIQ